MKIRSYPNKKVQCVFAIGVTVVCLAVGVTAVAANSVNADTAVRTELRQELLLYANEVENQNAALAEMNTKDIPVTITFSEYLSFDEIERYVEQYNIKIAQLQIRGLEEDGTRLTAFTRTDAGFAETEKILFDSAQNTGFNVKGIIGMYAWVDSENLTGIRNDPKTYLADTSGYSEQTQTQVKNAAQERGSLDVAHRSFPHSLAWKLEDAGLLG